MQQSNITFQNRKLTVDYITFNLQNGTSQIQKIANIFNADYSFDCYLVKVSGGDKVKVLGMAARGNTKNINRFQTLMKKIYGVDLKY